MLGARNDQEHGSADRSVPRKIMAVALAIAVAALAATYDVLSYLVCRFLVHLASEPYLAAELYDPSEDYELAREVLAIEKLITGRFGSVVGPGRVMRLFGGIEPMPGLVHCTAAMRTTTGGDDVFLAFEPDPLMLDDHDGEPSEYSVGLIRTPAAERWQPMDRQEFANATTALICFFSDKPVRIGRD